MRVPDPRFEAVPQFRRMMVFIDGENLVHRFEKMAETYEVDSEFMKNVAHEKGIYIWVNHMLPCVGLHEILRCTLYTYVQGDERRQGEIKEAIRSLKFRGHNCSLMPNNITPRVFKKGKGQKAKGVDISICVDALSHAARDHYDTAVLLSGDSDYLTLIHEIQSFGKQCYVGAFSSGLGVDIPNVADHFFCLDEPFFGAKKSRSEQDKTANKAA